jgi:AcrR family transcriptional regulator
VKTEESPRERIIKAAFSAFMEQGYAGTSTLEIATRAKVSKRDIYAEFGSKQAVLAACIASRSQRVRLPAETPEIRNREDLAAALIQFGRTQLKELTDPAVIGVFRLAIAEAHRTPEVARTLDETGRDAVRSALRDVMKKGLAAGLIGGNVPDMAGDFAALLFRGMLVDLMLGVAERPAEAEIDRRAQRAAEAFLKLSGA